MHGYENAVQRRERGRQLQREKFSAFAVNAREMEKRKRKWKSQKKFAL